MMNRVKTGDAGRLVRAALLAVLLVLSFGMSTLAASNGWVKKKNYCYYYQNKKPVKGLQKINGRTYYFDSKGIQRTSWRKIGKSYYCFNAEEKSGGYLLTNTTKNGIQIGPDGKADVRQKRPNRKVQVMVKVSSLLDKIMTKSKKTLSRKKKLKLCYDYLRKKYPYRLVSHFREKDPDFDLWSVEQLFKRHYADCVPYACTFAYLANALGYKDITILSWYIHKPRKTGHSWVQIGEKYYDVSLGRHNKKSFHLFSISKKKYKKIYPRYKIKNRKNIENL